MKATILKVGYVTEDGQPKDWAFNCHGQTVAIQLFSSGPPLFGGYTVEELREIAAKHGGQSVRDGDDLN